MADAQQFYNIWAGLGTQEKAEVEREKDIRSGRKTEKSEFLLVQKIYAVNPPTFRKSVSCLSYGSLESTDPGASNERSNYEIQSFRADLG